MCFTTNSPPRFTKIRLKRTLKKTNWIQRRLHVTETRPSSKTAGFVTYLHFKSNDWTPPRDPPRSPQKVPKPTRELPRTLRAFRGPSRTPRTSWESQHLTKLNKNSKTNNMKRIKTIENQMAYKENCKNIKWHARICNVNGCSTNKTVTQIGHRTTGKVRAKLQRWTHVSDIIRS